LSNGFKNDSDFLGESGGSAPHEDQDLELKKQELELCQTGPKPISNSWGEGWEMILYITRIGF
jgi:hypothetical protein